MIGNLAPCYASINLLRGRLNSRRTPSHPYTEEQTFLYDDTYNIIHDTDIPLLCPLQQSLHLQQIFLSFSDLHFNFNAFSRPSVPPSGFSNKQEFRTSYYVSSMDREVQCLIIGRAESKARVVPCSRIHHGGERHNYPR